jgi:RNA polymerase sigma factor (sigma-70 family)
MSGFLATLREAQAGDPQALRALIDRFRFDVQVVCQTVEVSGGDLSRADLQQEVWLRVLSRLNQFAGSDNETICEAMFRKWLRKSGRNVVLNVVEQRQALCRRPEHRPADIGARSSSAWAQDPEDSETPSRLAIAREEGLRVRAAIAAIPCPQQRRVVELRFLEQRSLRDIAAELGMTYDQARQRCADGLVFIEKLSGIAT